MAQFITTGIKSAGKFIAFSRIEATLGFWGGILIFLLTVCFPSPSSTLSENAWHCIGLCSLVAFWWATEPIPIPVTSLMPIILTPALGLASLDKATAPYANPTIFLFLGGFILGIAMETCNLHKRIALNILKRVGISPKRQIAGFMLATAFISMWMSNTATAVMMTPIGISVATLFVGDSHDKESEHFQVALLLGIAYSASIGGLATLIGTPPNALLRAFLEEYYDIHVGFGQWMLFGVPISFILLILTFWWLTRGKLKASLDKESAMKILDGEIAKLGPWRKDERWVLLLFSAAALCWMFQPFLAKIFPFVSDTFIAVFFSILMFVIPTDLSHRQFLMTWEQAEHIPWGILLLFGGGLSIANTISSSGLAEWLAQQLQIFAHLPLVAMVSIVVLVILFLTEITSNTATAAAFLPLVGAIAVAQGVNPELYTVPAAIAASCAFMLPVATPPNAIVFSSEVVTIGAMIRAGFALNIISAILITVFTITLVDIIF